MRKWVRVMGEAEMGVLLDLEALMVVKGAGWILEGKRSGLGW